MTELGRMSTPRSETCARISNFTLKERTLKRSNLDEFVQCFHAENRHERKDSGSKASPMTNCRNGTRLISTFSGFGTSRSKTARTFLILTCWRWRSLKSWKRLWSNSRRLRRTRSVDVLTRPKILKKITDDQRPFFRTRSAPFGDCGIL